MAKELSVYKILPPTENDGCGVTDISFDCDNLDRIIADEINNPEIRILTINKDGTTTRD